MDCQRVNPTKKMYVSGAVAAGGVICNSLRRFHSFAVHPPKKHAVSNISSIKVRRLNCQGVHRFVSLLMASACWTH